MPTAPKHRDHDAGLPKTLVNGLADCQAFAPAAHAAVLALLARPAAERPTFTFRPRFPVVPSFLNTVGSSHGHEGPTSLASAEHLLGALVRDVADRLPSTAHRIKAQRSAALAELAQPDAPAALAQTVLQQQINRNNHELDELAHYVTSAASFCERFVAWAERHAEPAAGR